MNKFDIFSDHTKSTSEKNVVQKKFRFYRDFDKLFEFDFSSRNESSRNIDVIGSDEEFHMRRAYATTSIVKSEIQEKVLKQIKGMFDEIKQQNEEVLYVKMSTQTKNLFRIYYSYDVDSLLKDLTEEDRQIKNLHGRLLCKKIILDESIEIKKVLPVVRVEKIKFKDIFDKGD